MENTEEFLTLIKMIQLEHSTSLPKFDIRDCDIKKNLELNCFCVGMISERT